MTRAEKIPAMKSSTLIIIWRTAPDPSEIEVQEMEEEFQPDDGELNEIQEDGIVLLITETLTLVIGALPGLLMVVEMDWLFVREILAVTAAGEELICGFTWICKSM